MYPVSVLPKNIKIELSDIESQNIDDNYLVEIPYDYLYLIISEMESALNKSLNNIYIEIKHNNKWQTQINKYNNIDWKYNLKIGDIIDVFDDIQCKWYQCMIRYTDKINNKIYIHYIGWMTKWNKIMLLNNDNILNKIDKRYSHTIKQHYPEREIILWELNDNKQSFKRIRISSNISKQNNKQIINKFGIETKNA